MPESIAVVIPTCGRPALLDRLLKSLEAQTLPRADFALFVVNDGADPKTEALLKAQNVPFESVPQKGPAFARNLGDDAVADRHGLNAAVSAYRSGVITQAGEGDVIRQGEPVPLSHSVHHPGPGGFLTCNLVITRRCFEAAGGFNERFRYAMNEDYEFFIRLKKRGPVAYVPNMKVYHPVRKTAFLPALFDAPGYARRRISSEYLLMALCPEEFKTVKYMPSANASIKRLAARYFVSAGLKQPGLVQRPVRGLFWLCVCMARQISFLYYLLRGYKG
jgi:GT2 family glycosyltransferase